MPTPRQSPRSLRLRAAVAIAAVALLPALTAGTTWLPGPSPLPRSLSDPREPRFALAYLPGPDRIDASLGAPFPLLGFDAAGARGTVSLEGAAYLTLGREGSRFPLRTVDGLFGLSVDARNGPWGVRLRLVHVSAHKADGDSTVSYPGAAYSKESAGMELFRSWGDLVVHGGMGAAWHSVPRDRGLHFFAGGDWRWNAGAWRPVASGYVEADRERAYRVSSSIFLGGETGRDLRVRLGIRGFNGLSPRGQARRIPERYAGIELQLAPESLQL